MANLALDTTTADGTSTLVDKDGNVFSKPNISLTSEEAELLRRYKKFLAAHHLREALFCSRCWQGTREDGCRAHVTDGAILIECRCRTRLFRGLAL